MSDVNIIAPLVSVIIPCRNEVSYIVRNISSIMTQDEPEGGFEIILADGMSDDGTRTALAELATKFPRLKFIDNPGMIVPTGLNLAIGVAVGKIIVRMDVHTEYAKDYIKLCVEILQQSKADNVGGAWIAKGNGYISNAIAIAFQSRLASGGAPSHNLAAEGHVDTVYLGCWMKESLLKYGLFDEELVRNQDDELNLRIIRSGGKIWQSPRIKSWYKPRNSLIALFKQYRQYGYWKVRVIQKHKIPAAIRHVVPGSFVLFLLLSIAIIMTTLAINIVSASPIFTQIQNVTTIVLSSVMGLYGVVILLASLLTAMKSGLKYFPVLPLVFMGYHFGYGIGFVEGIRDFYILKRFPDKSKTIITR